MSKHRAAPHRTGRRRTTGGFVGLAVLLTGAAVAVPLVSMARDGDPAESTVRVTVASDAPSPSVSPRPRAKGPNGEVAAAEDDVSRPSEPPASSVSIPERGPGRFDVAAASPSPIENATTYRVEVEEGLPYATDVVARFIQTTLADNRGWAAKHRLVRVDGHADLRIVLATPETTDALCAPLDTDGRLSCRNGSDVVPGGGTSAPTATPTTLPTTGGTWSIMRPVTPSAIRTWSARATPRPPR